MLTRKSDYSQDPCLNERIILKFILNKWDGNSWTEFIWYGIKASEKLLR